MKGKLLAFAFILFPVVTFAFTGCSPDDELPLQSSDMENNTNDGKETNMTLNIKIGEQTFSVTLEDNNTARAFVALLPMTVSMTELNGNEKYYYLEKNLPTESSRPGTIRAGDLMLYGSNCVVLFYETFSSSYSYTRIGHIDNPSELASVVGNGNVTVTFEP